MKRLFLFRLIFLSVLLGVTAVGMKRLRGESLLVLPSECPNATFAIPSNGNLGWPYLDPAGGVPGYSNVHTGIDIHGTIDDDVYAAYNGVVTKRDDPIVWIWHPDLGVETFYSHLSSISVNLNDTVTKGQPIGKKGNVGTNGGAVHLHFSVKKKGTDERYIGNTFDPSPYLGANVNYQNGAKSYQRPVSGWCHNLRLAVTPPYYDDIGSILSQSELNYPWTEIPVTDLSNYSSLSEFAVVFINCTANIQSTPQVANALQHYVQNGGSLYLSDWAYEYIQDAFPGYINFPANPKIGTSQLVVADIDDSSLSNYINPVDPPSTIDLNYDLPEWVVIDNVGPDTTVHMRGSFETLSSVSQITSSEGRYQLRTEQGLQGSSQLINRPLAVSFQPYGPSGGKVIYTTFHNEAQQSQLEKKLLEYLVLVPLTSVQQQQVAQAIAAQGLDLLQANLNTTQLGTTDRFVYSYLGAVTDLRLAFALAWPGSGLRLSVFQPDGSLYESVESSQSPIEVVVPAADHGEWIYQVTGIDVPYDNYPYAVGVGAQSIEQIFVPMTFNNYDSEIPPPPVIPPTPTPLAAPYPQWPGNDAIVEDNTPTFGWNVSAGATIYELQVNNDASFSSPEISISTENLEYTPSWGLSNEVYSWRVRASKTIGNWSDWSVVWNVVIDQPSPPAAPDYLQATALDTNRIQLSWADNSDDEAGFSIFDGAFWVASVGADTTSYIAEDLGINSYHCYRIFAFNDYGISPWTDWSCAATDTVPLIGTVTDNGIAATGIEILLQFYDGFSTYTYSSTATDAEGQYQFSNPPPLGDGQSLFVLWANTDGDIAHLWYWSCSTIDHFTTDPDAYQCDFDVDNMDMLSPANGVTVSLPYIFTWSKRDIVTDDYSLVLAGMSDSDPWWWTDPSLGYVDSFTFDSLPSGFSPGVQYGWYLLVTGPDGSGVSRFHYLVTFSNAGTSEVESSLLPGAYNGNIRLPPPPVLP